MAALTTLSAVEEEEKICQWIDKNGLNKYGDVKNTMYTGCTPLFNESTGESMDRIEFIKSKHPNSPWL